MTSPLLKLSTLTFRAVMVVAAFVANQAAAGPLATTNFAFDDSFGPDAGRWHGSVIVAGAVFGDTLNATIDWAVFAPGDFQQYLDSEGIAQADPTLPGELIYVYQIVSITLASPGIDTLTLKMDPLAERGSLSAPAFIPTGAANEVSPSGGGDNNTSMAWFFLTDRPQVGDISSLLVFTSPFAPEFGFINMNSGLAGAIVSPLAPTPSDRRFVPTPEPSSLLLALLGCAALVGGCRATKRSRVA